MIKCNQYCTLLVASALFQVKGHLFIHFHIFNLSAKTEHNSSNLRALNTNLRYVSSTCHNTYRQNNLIELTRIKFLQSSAAIDIHEETVDHTLSIFHESRQKMFGIKNEKKHLPALSDVRVS